MPSIKQLDKKTIAKIAAGEVVERPLSVVKELTENAIDAGSTEIFIELKDGGNTLIRISDNGCGMSKEDVEMCVRSHTTSKLSEIDDLTSLRTLGFRGEALYSISAVSRLTVTSRAKGSEDAHSITVESGAASPAETASRAPGTTIEVENLFFNVPARMKFQKSSRTEIQAVEQLITRLMIAFPEISFRLSHNGSEVVSAPVAETRMERIAHVLGKDLAAHTQQAGGTLKGMELTAYFGLPDLSFSNRRYQIFFVNGHIVKDKTMSMAVDIAYKGLINPSRYPLVVLFLDVPPSDADFNVHPAKTEIRFANSHDVHSLVYRVLRGRFVEGHTAPGDKPFSLIIGGEKKTQQEESTSPQPSKLRYDPPQPSAPLLAPWEENSVQSAPDVSKPEAQPSTRRTSIPEDDLDRELARQAELALMPEGSRTADGHQTYAESQFEVLGQFFNLFILVRLNGEPVFIDQHIASERIIYNRLKRSGASRPSQMMLLGEPVELPRDVCATLSSNLDTIKEIGLEVEPFGERAFIVRSVVHNSGRFNPAALLTSLANEIDSSPGAAQREDLLDRLYVATACELAIQGGQQLTLQEMHSLMREYLVEEFNATCPHGRPIIKKLSLDEMKTWFKR